MRVDYMCNECGYEFSLNTEDDTEKRCPGCETDDIFTIPVRMPDEGYQSCVFDE